MFRLSVAIALSLISITACGRSSPPSAAPTAPAKEVSAPAPKASAPAAATADTAGQTPESAEATASQETTTDTPTEDRGDAGLEHLAAMPADQQLPGGKWKAGTNYVPLVPAQPTNVAPGK